MSLDVPARSAVDSDDAVRFFVGSVVFAAAMPLVVATFISVALLHGFVLMKLWNWFMPGTFGLPPLGLGSAIAVHLTLRAALIGRAPQKDDVGFGVHAASTLLGAALILAAGWLLHLAMAHGYLAN